MHGGATVLTVWKVQCTLISVFFLVLSFFSRKSQDPQKRSDSVLNPLGDYWWITSGLLVNAEVSRSWENGSNQVHWSSCSLSVQNTPIFQSALKTRAVQETAHSSVNGFVFNRTRIFGKWIWQIWINGSVTQDMCRGCIVSSGNMNNANNKTVLGPVSFS